MGLGRKAGRSTWHRGHGTQILVTRGGVGERIPAMESDRTGFKSCFIMSMLCVLGHKAYTSLSLDFFTYKMML